MYTVGHKRASAEDVCLGEQ